jgi:hypothetical protein
MLAVTLSASASVKNLVKFTETENSMEVAQGWVQAQF